MQSSAATLKIIINRNIRVAQNTRKSDLKINLAERNVLKTLKRLDNVYNKKVDVFCKSHDTESNKSAGAK